MVICNVRAPGPKHWDPPRSFREQPMGLRPSYVINFTALILSSTTATLRSRSLLTGYFPPSHDSS